MPIETSTMEQRQANRTKISAQTAGDMAIPIRLQIDKRHRDLALFNLAIDSKLRACDLLKIRVSDVSNSGRVSSRAMFMQQKTQRPVQFEITA